MLIPDFLDTMVERFADLGQNNPAAKVRNSLVNTMAFIFGLWWEIISFYRTRVRSLAMLVTNSLTDWLTHCRLVNLIDMTLVCEDAYSKLVEIVTVADVCDENRNGNSLLQIWKLRFGHKA